MSENRLKQQQLIGLTGGIGSGKSTIARVLEAMGYPVFYSDVVGKELLVSDVEIRRELVELVGEKVYEDGRLNRSYLAQRIFSDDGVRLRVNTIVHPRVRAAFDDFVERQTSELIFNEAAILFETGAYTKFDKTVLVTAPLELRIARVMKRDNCSREEVLERVNKQWTDAEKIVLADWVIVNDDKKSVLMQLEAMVSGIVLT
jgi:dephospho-CoA kinase